MRSTSLVTSIILVSILLTGCGKSQSVSTPIPPTNTPLLPTITPNPPTATPTPKPPTATPFALTTIEDLVGNWERKGLGQTFRDDATFLSFEKGVWSCSGHYWFEGNQLYIEDYTDHCSTLEAGIYEVQGVPQDYLIIKTISDYSGSRKSHFRGTWHWVGPP